MKDNDDNFIGLSFSEWMEREYGDVWPTSDIDNEIWNRYMEYVKDEERLK